MKQSAETDFEQYLKREVCKRLRLFTDLFHHYDGVIEIYEVVSEGQQPVSNVAQQESQV